MGKQKWTLKILIRYTVIQLLSLVVFIMVLFLIRTWVSYPLWVEILLVAVWIAKDASLFPLTWKAYDWDGNKVQNTMIGSVGRALEDLSPEGYIMIRGELWRAVVEGCESCVKRGRSVVVKNIEGLTLVVTILDEGEKI